MAKPPLGFTMNYTTYIRTIICYMIIVPNRKKTVSLLKENKQMKHAFTLTPYRVPIGSGWRQSRSYGAGSSPLRSASSRQARQGRGTAFDYHANLCNWVLVSR